MGEKFPDKRLRGSQQVYAVFREAVRRENGVYSKQLHDEGFVGSREDANRLLSALRDKGILEKGERTKAQFYVPDWAGIADYVPSLYDADFSLPERFVERYVEAYVRYSRESSLREMLREDLVTAMRAYRAREGLPEFLIEFLDALGPEAEAYDRKILDVMDYAVENSTS